MDLFRREESLIAAADLAARREAEPSVGRAGGCRQARLGLCAVKPVRCSVEVSGCRSARHEVGKERVLGDTGRPDEIEMQDVIFLVMQCTGVVPPFFYFSHTVDEG